MRNFFKHFFLGPRFYFALGTIILCQILSAYFITFNLLADMAIVASSLLFLADIFMLYRHKKPFFARRGMSSRLSNGDENAIRIYLENRYPFPVKATILDELPVQFQVRDFTHTLQLAATEKRATQYHLKPLKRGEYHFGLINVFVSGPIGFIQRRFACGAPEMTPVYPSYIQMRKYELLAISNRLTEAGVKKIRRVGHTMEFDQIRDYVIGDDYRTVNWKATARKNALMVNHYQDERSQQVFSVINMGRVMKMPFEGMSLLDYAINASLVISNIAIRKQDKAGIITFSHKIDSVLSAERKPLHISKIMELLYRQETDFLESNYDLLFSTILQKLKQRSLLLLFTNFESLTSLKRQVSALRKIAAKHLLVVIFFENTELQALLARQAVTTEEVYQQTIAGQFAYEKKQIVKELQRYGIYSILTTPEQLSVNTINKYLYLKARGFI